MTSSGPPAWPDAYRISGDWRGDVEAFAKKLPSELRAKLNICALSHDGPGWLLCGTKGDPERGELLVIGAGWGRQMELLQHEFSGITIVEKNPVHAEFLKTRFQDAPEAIAIYLLSDRQALQELCAAKQFDVVFIRGDFIREWSKAEIDDTLALVGEDLPERAEFVIETWEVDSVIERAAKVSFIMSSKEVPPTRRWWQHNLEQCFEGTSRLYRVQGPHWCAQTYMPWNDRGAQGANRAPQDYLNLSRYIERLEALADPSAVLIVHNRRAATGVAIIDDMVATSEGANEPAEPSGFRVSGRGTAMGWPVERGPVLRIPLTPRARSRCEFGHEALETLHQQLPAELKYILPTSHHRDYSSTMPVYSEPLMAGVSGTQRLSQQKLDNALEWLAKLHANTHCTIKNPESEAGRALQKRLAELVELGDIILERQSDHAKSARWTSLRDALLNPPWKHGIALCMTHGDFHIGNLLFTEDKLSGVIDWETAASPTLPIRDLFWFALSAKIVGQHATAEIYERDLLAHKPPSWLKAYYQTVGADMWRSIWHPWCRLVYPLERLKTVWDGYDLTGVVEPNPMAGDWGDLVIPLAKFQEREGLLRTTR